MWQVSTEVDAHLSFDTQATVDKALSHCGPVQQARHRPQAHLHQGMSLLLSPPPASGSSPDAKTCCTSSLQTMACRLYCTCSEPHAHAPVSLQRVGGLYPMGRVSRSLNVLMLAADCINLGGHQGVRDPAEAGHRHQHDPPLLLCTGEVPRAWTVVKPSLRTIRTELRQLTPLTQLCDSQMCNSRWCQASKAACWRHI